MRINQILLTCFLFFLTITCPGNDLKKAKIFSSEQILELINTTTISENVYLSRQSRPTPILQLFHKKRDKQKKATAAILAFPLPFGIVGLHRIYLGSAPYVPVAYIATLGGALGLLPFIDFCAILSNKKLDPYVNNKKVFMWVN